MVIISQSLIEVLPGPVAVTGNFIRGSKKAMKLDLRSGNTVTDRENVFTD